MPSCRSTSTLATCAAKPRVAYGVPVERPVKPFVVLPARSVEQIELMDGVAVTFLELERGHADQAHRSVPARLTVAILGPFLYIKPGLTQA